MTHHITSNNRNVLRLVLHLLLLIMTERNVSDEKTVIYNFLIETGCCKRCALRLLGEGDAVYDNPQEYVKKFTSPNLEQNGCDEPKIKKTKSNPCIVCLNLLHDTVFETMLSRPEVEKIAEYDCITFVNYISFPTSLLIREHSMEVYMKEKFSSFFKDHHIVPLNRAWSLSIQNKLAERIGKKFDKNSHLQIQFTMTYEYEKEEVSVMFDVESKLKKFNGHNDALSKNVIGESLKSIDSNVFQKYVSVPPQAPTKSVDLDQVFCKHDSIFIAGRYCKYSRNMFQTPWVVEDEQIATTSVQEIIFQSLDNIFNCSSLVFSSSGREDFDVRTLGRGRPFFIKICDPKVTNIPFEQFRSIEATIKQSNMVKVRDLQITDKKYINNIKEGEQFKKKTYKALCIVNQPENLTTYINKINSVSKITLQQKTPLRVYHRRSADVRERDIYSIKAKLISGKDNLFELDVITQAGTYVKEFVHGDLGRTKPSLSDIIGGYVDIIALDVLDIDLDFPPSLSQNLKVIES